MAKLFKISAHIVDFNDEFDESNIAEYLTYATQKYFNLNHLKVDGADIGEWEDEHPLNYIDCPKAEFEKYFKEN